MNEVPFVVYEANAKENIKAFLAVSMYHLTSEDPDSPLGNKVFDAVKEYALTGDMSGTIREAVNRMVESDGFPFILANPIPEKPAVSAIADGTKLSLRGAHRIIEGIHHVLHIQGMGKPYNRPYGLAGNLPIEDNTLEQVLEADVERIASLASDKEDYFPVEATFEGNSVSFTSPAFKGSVVFPTSQISWLADFASMQ